MTQEGELRWRGTVPLTSRHLPRILAAEQMPSFSCFPVPTLWLQSSQQLWLRAALIPEYAQGVSSPSYTPSLSRLQTFEGGTMPTRYYWINIRSEEVF